MTKSISQEKRNQVVGMAAGGIDLQQVAAHFGLHRNTISKIVNQYRRQERRLRNRPNQPTSLQELRDTLAEEWNAIPREVWRNLILSMRRRCLAVVQANGGHTRY